MRFHRSLCPAVFSIVAIGALLISGHAGKSQDTAQRATFYRDVLPILQQHCQVCHRSGGIAPVPLETYEQARRFAAAIKIAAKNRSMPPWFAEPGIGKFSNDPSLSKSEIAALASWADDHTLAGNPTEAPPPKKWAQRWSIASPNLELKMPDPVKIPAGGELDYTYEIVPTRFSKDRWVRGCEILPGMRENVHHAVVYIRPPNSPWLRHAPVGKSFTASSLTSEQDRKDAMWTTSDILLVYAPGSTPDDWSNDTAKFIPAGSDLVFQMHYTTNGRAGTDESRVGLIFAKETPSQRVLTLQLTNDHFVIPPGAPDYRVEARGTLPNDATLLSFFPHMHLRGKRFEYNIIQPDKTLRPLLRVDYDFHWQMSYKLAQPLVLKAGTQLQAVAWYDNSAKNLHNPDPEAAVSWGEQTYDEMMVGFFDVAVAATLGKQEFFLRNDPAKSPN